MHILFTRSHLWSALDLLSSDSSVQSRVSSSNLTCENSRLMALGAEKLRARELPMWLQCEQQTTVNTEELSYDVMKGNE